MKRLYTISLPGTGRSWKTTNCFAAMTFLHSFGEDAGFHLSTEMKESPEIYDIEMDYSFDVIEALKNLWKAIKNI